MIRRRREAISARERWLAGPQAFGRAFDSPSGRALLFPRAGKMIDLLQLDTARTYLDISLGGGGFAELLARGAGSPARPVVLDVSAAGDPVDLVAWPEQLPFRDASFDAVTVLHVLRGLDDDAVHGFAEELSRILAPGGAGLIVEFAPVRWGPLNDIHRRIVSGGCAEVDLRGWGRMAALLTECGFDAIDLVELGPFALPPIPRVCVLVRRSP
ncbi:MAG: methyltransferase domain-containing protein [Dehalococcoidia bacterium]|nr:methyltransferase domain-containing protein [Dehalococcoidia bacterium]MYK26869.1 methyltransferase domain-containing protein [Dehalococcoidia bacterium]